MKKDTLTLLNKSVVVTGGCGFIPSHLIDALISEKPEKIIVLDKFLYGCINLGKARRLFKNLKLIKCDVANIRQLKNIITKEKIDIVFHLATLSLNESLLRPEKVIRSLLGMILNLLELQRNNYFQTLISVSSSEAYGSATFTPMTEDHILNPNTPYAAAKASVDFIALSYYKTFGNDLVIVRPFNNYGPRQNPRLGGVVTSAISTLLKNNRPVIFGSGEQSRDFLYVKDTVKGIIKAYKNPSTRGKVINLGTGKETKIKDIVNALIKISGQKIKPDFKEMRTADVNRHSADFSLAKKLLGWKPKTSLEKGLRETYQWYKNNKFVCK